MWDEIKKTAKTHIIRILYEIKFQLTTFDNITKHGEELIDYLIKTPASDTVLIRWKCIIDLFIENEFI